MTLSASTRRHAVTCARLYEAHDAAAANPILAAVPGARDLREDPRTTVAAWLPRAHLLLVARSVDNLAVRLGEARRMAEAVTPTSRTSVRRSSTSPNA